LQLFVYQLLTIRYLSQSIKVYIGFIDHVYFVKWG